MFGIGMTELLVILIIILLLFGPKRLPELARGLGRALAEFRRTSEEVKESMRVNLYEEDPTETTSLEDEDTEKKDISTKQEENASDNSQPTQLSAQDAYPETKEEK